MVKVEQSAPKNMTEARGGDKHWKSSHLPDNKKKVTKNLFSQKVLPRAIKKLAALDPWLQLTVQMVQDIIDEVFPEKKGKKDYIVEQDNVWHCLVSILDCFSVANVHRHARRPPAFKIGTIALLKLA